MIWLAPLIEHANEQGGKGGPQQKVFNYTQSIAIGLCERVDDYADGSQGAIGGLTRVWENGKLVFDIRPQLHANTATGQHAETDAQYTTRLSVSATYAEKFTLYIGTELQDPDPTIEAVEGFGNVPGFRGLAYVVFPNRQLQQGQGLRHPNFTFECYQDGTGNCENSTVASNQVLHPWISNGGDPSNPLNVNTYRISEFSGGHLPSYGSQYSTWFFERFTSADAAAALVASYYVTDTGVDPQIRIVGYDPYATGVSAPGYLVGSSGNTGATALSGMINVAPDPLSVGIHYAPISGKTLSIFRNNAQRGAAINTIRDPLNSVRWEEILASPPYAIITWVCGPNSDGTSAGDPGTIAPFDYSTQQGTIAPDYTHGQWAQVTYSTRIECERAPSAPKPPCYGLLPYLPDPTYAIQSDGSIIKCNSWIIDNSTAYRVLQTFTASGGSGIVPLYPLNPCIAITDPEYNDAAMWTAAYNAAVTLGQMPSGLTYGAGYPVTAPANTVYRIDQIICEGSGAAANVAAVVEAICKRAGLTAAQIDVSDLAAQSIVVPGYSISAVCDAVSIISPLRSIAFFDCVETGGMLRFPTRGKEIVAELTTDQIGCFDGDITNASSVPPSLAVTRTDETTLPRSIRFHYKAVSRDYQDAQQLSPFRLSTRAVNDQDISIPLCIGDTEALQSAEVLWSDAWAAQDSYTFSIDQSLLELEGADCIGVPVNGVIQRMRIVSDKNASGVLRQLNCVADGQGSYISFQVAAPPATQPQTLQQLSQAIAVLLNIPALSDADNNAGFYAVAYPDPATGTLWNGALLYQSTDGGLTYSLSTLISTAATVGTVHAPVPSSEAIGWDNSTVITIDCDASQSFSSRTDDAVLAGANAAAMGEDGRWEIVQFANATQVSATQWHLSRLLRGRRGTEHVLGSSQAADKFIIISTGDAVRVPLSVGQIGAVYSYTIVSNGASFASGVSQTFASTGTALLPFSPVAAAADAVTGGDISITWTRRDRLGRTLMSGVDIPLSDPPESFQVDICNGGSPLIVHRTLSTSTTSVLYTAAMQTADSFTGTTLYVRIYQISPSIGRGTPDIETLTVS